MIRITTDRAINEKITEIMDREEERRLARVRTWELEKRISRLEDRVRQLEGEAPSGECPENVTTCGY